MVYSLFIGRWQPFHEGHKALIETVLRSGKEVLVAIRDTELSSDNPLTVEERRTLILSCLSTWGDRVRVIPIPDISEVCYGRDVGYRIRQIGLSQEIESISGREVRSRW